MAYGFISMGNLFWASDEARKIQLLGLKLAGKNEFFDFDLSFDFQYSKFSVRVSSVGVFRVSSFEEFEMKFLAKLEEINELERVSA